MMVRGWRALYHLNPHSITPHTAIFHTYSLTDTLSLHHIVSLPHPHYRWTILVDRRWMLVVLRTTAVPMKLVDSSVVSVRTGGGGGG